MTRLCIALDTDYEKAVDLIKSIKNKEVVFKVGYKLFISHHRKITDLIKQEGFELFLDLKLHDIPNTVKDGVLSARELGADYLTVHVSAGSEALRSAVEVAEGLKLLGVTLLTSLEEPHLKELGVCVSKDEYVVKLSALALSCGLSGLVCSGKELPLLKSKFNFFAVVPGVRLEEESSDDQKRVVSLQEAIKKGADMLVLGRSILRAEDPIQKVEDILVLLSSHP
ncbi:orotidine-5'-phosphate decarboxylase [Thermocrinis sp.]